MIIRRAEAADAVAICAIANRIIRDTLVTFTTTERSTAEVAAEIAARGERFRVAELDGAVVGFASYGRFRDGPGYARTAEHSIQLTEAVRGRGIGRALLGDLEEVARKGEVHVLVAGISGANPQGLAFHASMGFRDVGRLPQVGRKFGRWLDLVLMQKILD